ncbi:MAG: CYTH domain-containing protein [Bacteroides sp.]|nr:CYTH domain-containing protein [Bacteroides sp.]
MGKEIERKFLVKPDTDMSQQADRSVKIIQGYLSTDPAATVRIRVVGNKGVITVKGKTNGIERSEWEYEIPAVDAEEMLEQCSNKEVTVIKKTRYYCGRWEIDEYHGDLNGLVTAEIELSSPEEKIDLPDWIEKEVSDDPRYFNSMLARFGLPDKQIS